MYTMGNVGMNMNTAPVPTGVSYQNTGKPTMYVFFPPPDSVIASANAEGTTAIASRPILLNPSDHAIGQALTTIDRLKSTSNLVAMGSTIAAPNMLTSHNSMFTVNGAAVNELPVFNTTSMWHRPSFLLVIPSATNNVAATFVTAPTYCVVSGVCSDYPFDERTGIINQACSLIIGAGNYISTPALAHNPMVTGFVRSRNDVITHTTANTHVSHGANAKVIHDGTARTNCGAISIENSSYTAVDMPMGPNMVGVSMLESTNALNNPGAKSVDFNIRTTDPVVNASQTMATIMTGVERAVNGGTLAESPYSSDIDLTSQVRNTMYTDISRHTLAESMGTSLLNTNALIAGQSLTMGQIVAQFGDVDIHPIYRPSMSDLGGIQTNDTVSSIMGQYANQVLSRVLLEQQITQCALRYQSLTGMVELERVGTYSGELTMDMIRLKASHVATALNQEFRPISAGMGFPNFVLSSTFGASFGTTTIYQSLDSNEYPDTRGVHSPLFMGVVGTGTMLANYNQASANANAAAHMFTAITAGVGAMMNGSQINTNIPQSHLSSQLFPANIAPSQPIQQTPPSGFNLLPQTQPATNTGPFF